VVVGVAAEEDTRRFGIVGVREGRIGEGDGEEVEECGGEEDGWDYVSEGRLPPGGKLCCSFIATCKDVEIVKIVEA
jgi:hypothetical protein